MPHFGGVHTWGYDPQIPTLSRFFYNAPTPQVASSYVYSFINYSVEKPTNKQTDAAENIRYDVG